MKFNYRKINALSPKHYKKYYKSSLLAYNLRNLMLITFVVIALFQIQLLVGLDRSFMNALNENESRVQNYKYWDSVAGQFPNIPDILYNTALSALEVGRPDEALRFVEQALRVDPLFDKALKLKEEILKG